MAELLSSIDVLQTGRTHNGSALEVAMPTLTLKEKQLPGDLYTPSPPHQGDPWLIRERGLERNGTQVGSYTVRGTYMTPLVNGDALIAVNGTNKITGIPRRRGTICTQGVFRITDFANPVVIAIVGGTGHFKKARGTLTIYNQTLTFKW
jgi:hypothetical protein